MKKFLRAFFLFSIILSPFDGLPWFGLLGELSCLGYIYPSFIGMIIFLIMFFKKEIEVYLPKERSLYFFIGFMFVILISGIVNLNEIIYANTKGRTGIEKFSLQYIVVVFYLLLSIYYYYNIKTMKNPYVKIFKMIEISFYITLIYSFFQVLFILQFEIGRNVVTFVNPLIIYRDTEINAFFRVQGVSFEPSCFGMYMSFALPWLMGWCYLERSFIRQSIVIFGILTIFFSTSRTAYYVTIVEIIAFSILFYEKLFRNIRKMIYLTSVIIILLGVCIYLENNYEWLSIGKVVFSFFDEGTTFSLSNVGRFGSQMAGINIFLQYPFLGCGWGQFGFLVADYMPNWAYVTEEVIRWTNSAEGTGWAVVFNVYIRILAEIGIIGFFFWIYIWVSIFIKLFKSIHLVNNNDKILIKILMISLLGVFLSGFNFDTIRFFGYWLILPIAWDVFAKIKRKEKLILYKTQQGEIP